MVPYGTNMAEAGAIQCHTVKAGAVWCHTVKAGAVQCHTMGTGVIEMWVTIPSYVRCVGS